jgi:hypothetical protein
MVAGGNAAFFKAGVPLVAFVCVGSWALSTFVQGHYEKKDLKTKSLSQRQYSLEEEHKKMLKKLDIDDYEMVPAPKVGK